MGCFVAVGVVMPGVVIPLHLPHEWGREQVPFGRVGLL